MFLGVYAVLDLYLITTTRPHAMIQTQTFRPTPHKNRKHSIMFMMKSMLRKTLEWNQ